MAFAATQGRRFARRPDRNDSGNPTGDLRFNQTLQRRDVDFVVSKRGNEGCVCP